MNNSRRFARKSIDGSVEMLINGGVFLGEMRDLSEGGVGVVTSTPYQVGYEMFLSLRLSQAAESLAALAEVIWVHPIEAAFHPTGMGLKFLALTEEDFFRLEKILELA